MPMAGDGNFTPSATHARVWPSKALTRFCKGNPDHWVFRNSLSANKDTRKHIRQAYFLLFRPLGFRDFPQSLLRPLRFPQSASIIASGEHQPPSPSGKSLRQYADEGAVTGRHQKQFFLPKLAPCPCARREDKDLPARQESTESAEPVPLHHRHCFRHSLA